MAASSAPRLSATGRSATGSTRSGNGGGGLSQPEEAPTEIHRSMFSTPTASLAAVPIGPRTSGPPSTPGARSSVARSSAGTGLTNQHLRNALGAHGGSAASRASSIAGGAKPFSVVSDEEVIDVDGQPTSLGDEDMGLGGPSLDPLDMLQQDTPLSRLQEVLREAVEVTEQAPDDTASRLALVQLALGHVKVVWRAQPEVVHEQPLLLAQVHYELARAYQAHGCGKQAADHCKQSLAAIPASAVGTDTANALKCELHIMRAEALLDAAAALGTDGSTRQALAQRALVSLKNAVGKDEVDEVEDMGAVALMAQCHSIVAEVKLVAARAARAAETAAQQRAAVAAARYDAAAMQRMSEGGYGQAASMDKMSREAGQARAEASGHAEEAAQMGLEAEEALDQAMYCLNHVIDQEGTRLESELGREGKTEHPVFRALWQRSLELLAMSAEAMGLQGKPDDQLRTIGEMLSAHAQYQWLPGARIARALKDKGALLVAKQDYEGAGAAYEQLEELVAELYADEEVRRELQGAEVLKLRGDVALASQDFRTAQHLFSKALEQFQKHLGVQSGVARDLMHRIDEVKAYITEARVLGGTAPAASLLMGSHHSHAGGSSPSTPKTGVGIGSVPSTPLGQPPRSPAMPRSAPGSQRPGSSLSHTSYGAGGIGGGSTYGGGAGGSAYGGGAGSTYGGILGGAAGGAGSTYGAGGAGSTYGAGAGGGSTYGAGAGGGSTYGAGAGSTFGGGIGAGSTFGGGAMGGSTFGGGGAGSRPGSASGRASADGAGGTTFGAGGRAGSRTGSIVGSAAAGGSGGAGRSMAGSRLSFSQSGLGGVGEPVEMPMLSPGHNLPKLHTLSVHSGSIAGSGGRHTPEPAEEVKPAGSTYGGGAGSTFGGGGAGSTFGGGGAGSTFGAGSTYGGGDGNATGAGSTFGGGGGAGSTFGGGGAGSTFGAGGAGSTYGGDGNATGAGSTFGGGGGAGSTFGGGGAGSTFGAGGAGSTYGGDGNATGAGSTFGGGGGAGSTFGGGGAGSTFGAGGAGSTYGGDGNATGAGSTFGGGGGAGSTFGGGGAGSTFGGDGNASGAGSAFGGGGAGSTFGAGGAGSTFGGGGNATGAGSTFGAGGAGSTFGDGGGAGSTIGAGGAGSTFGGGGGAGSTFGGGGAGSTLGGDANAAGSTHGGGGAGSTYGGGAGSTYGGAAGSTHGGNGAGSRVASRAGSVVGGGGGSGVGGGSAYHSTMEDKEEEPVKSNGMGDDYW